MPIDDRVTGQQRRFDLQKSTLVKELTQLPQQIGKLLRKEAA